MVSNLGNCEDTFTLTAASSQDWATPHPPSAVTLTLVPRVITVPVDVESGAGFGDRATITLIATSHFRPAVQAVATDMIIVDYRYKDYLPLIFRDYIPPAPDLSTSEKRVEWSLDGSQVTLNFTIDLTNTGTLTATHLLLTDKIPDGTTYLPDSITADIECGYEAAGDQIVCNDSLGIGEHTSVSFMAEVSSEGPCSNIAYVDDDFHQSFPLAIVLLNGDFGSGDFLPCWHETGPIETDVVPPSEPDNCFDSFAARLGEPGKIGGIPVGNGTIYQSVTLPPSTSPKLEFDYCMYSYDIKQGCVNKKWYDTFEVAINDINDPLIRIGNTDDCEPGDLREKEDHISRDLSSFAGQTIRLYFSVWNRVDHNYNTWVYIDNVRIVP